MKSGRRGKMHIMLLYVCFSGVLALLVACTTSGSAGMAQGVSTPGSTAPTSNAAPTQVPAYTTPSASIGLLQGIRMVDTSNGWALTTKNAVLKTSNGGRNWQSVTPGGLTSSKMVQGEFLTTRTAWIAADAGLSQPITILHTSDGGASWQSTTINNVTGGLVRETLHFINVQQGWLVTSQAEGMLHYTTNVYRTIDGGQTWTNVSGAQRFTAPSGISFANAQTGWLGLEWPGSGVEIEKTVNGGQSWQQLQLPAPVGINSTQVGETQTTAPVLIGASGLLPVHIHFGQTPTPRLVLYTTRNGGANWASGVVAGFDSSDVYALDTQRIWAEETSNNALHFSSDGGKSWTQLTLTQQHFDALSFVDAHNGWAIDDAGHLYQTTNGGTGWSVLS